MRQELAADRAGAAADDAVLHAEPIVGYTAGTFDMFHIGHLNFLRRARSSCDRLIVGVSTDELVMQHKGKIPVLPFEERLEIVRAVRYVDEVVLQESMDKLLAWERVRFDRLSSVTTTAARRCGLDSKASSAGSASRSWTSRTRLTPRARSCGSGSSTSR
jgi:cytidyltransferase-like protein